MLIISFQVAVAASLAAANASNVVLNGAPLVGAYPGVYAAGAIPAGVAYAGVPAVAPAPVAAVAPAVPVSTASVAAVPAAPHSQQFHTQDEFGNLAFGYSNPNSARHEEGNSLAGVRRGGWSWVDANGVLQRTEYVADPVHGFQVQATNLPVAPVFAGVAPIDTGVAPAPVVDTPEVAAAKAEHLAAVAEATAAAGEEHRRKRSTILGGAPALVGGYALPAGGLFAAPYTAGAGIVAAPAAPALGVPSLKQTLKLTPGHAVSYRVYHGDEVPLASAL